VDRQTACNVNAV